VQESEAYHLYEADGAAEVACGWCDHEYTVEVVVSYVFRSPPRSTPKLQRDGRELEFRDDEYIDPRTGEVFRGDEVRWDDDEA
jgi:hypothetical protein